MGTSRTNDGPGDRPPLLPPWALPGGGPPPVPPEPPPGDPEGGDGGDAADSQGDGGEGDVGQGNLMPGTMDGPGVPGTPPGSSVPPQAPWRAARRQMNGWARGGGGREGVSRAGRAYVRAKGGARAAASRAVHGRATAARAGRFFGALASGGLRAALETLGLRDYVGRGAEEVFAAIANAISPAGATLEEAAARRAADEVLARLYDERVGADGDLAGLERMAAQDVATAVRDVVSAYVYQRWLEELGKSIETGTTSPAEAVRLEREVRQYVRDIVQLEVPNDRVLTLDWEKPDGQALVQRLFEEAYGLLEEGE